MSLKFPKAFSTVGGDNIVSISSKRQDRSPACNGLECYWHALSTGKGIPSRSDIEPRGLGVHLEHSFIAEKISPALARIRVAGTALRELQGIELRGMPLSYMIDATGREQFADTLSKVFSGPKIAKLDLVSPRIFGRSQLRAQMILLPLKDDLGNVARLIGAIDTDGHSGRSPRHFLIENVEFKNIMQEAPNACDGVLQSGPARTARLERNAPFLKLVSSD